MSGGETRVTALRRITPHLDADDLGLIELHDGPMDFEHLKDAYYSRRTDVSGREAFVFTYTNEAGGRMSFFTRRRPEHYGVSWTVADVCVLSFWEEKDDIDI